MKKGKRDEHTAGNIRAARVILANPEKYAGGLLMWAQLIAETHDITPEETQHGALGNKDQGATVQPPGRAARGRLQSFLFPEEE